MIILEGKFAKCKVFTNELDSESQKQLIDILNHPMSKDTIIRVMPDVHAGAGCVVGFTSTLSDKIVPNIVGVDIGCGVLTAVLEGFNIDLKELDDFIRATIPLGMNIHKSDLYSKTIKITDEIKYVSDITGQDYDYIIRSLGTLGGGNHFLEVEKGKQFYYLTVHSGSRNFGLKIAKFHQKKAENIYKNKIKHDIKNKIEDIKQCFKGKEIEREILKLKSQMKIPTGQEYLTGEDVSLYLEHMKIAQKYATLNRHIILNNIINRFNLSVVDYIESKHNYIDLEYGIIRKGAISARKDEKVVIPLNMRDGIVIGKGRGNEDWNYSAPHGAGRALSRRKAKESLSIEQFKNEMEGIWSTSINEATLDESPMAYKDSSIILNYLKETVIIEDIARPIYVIKGDC